MKARTKDDRETRIQKLDASQAEGEERLAEKNAVMGHCAASKARQDASTAREGVDKYKEQPG